MSAGALPIIVLTGFLGSGKTTLLRHALQRPDMADTAVLINEIGEIGLDHILVDHIDEDTVLLATGCLCCAMRADLTGALRRLLLRRQAGDAPPLRRVVIETSGLADPAPILATLGTTGFIRDRCAVSAVVTTVDALCGADALARHPEARRQVAFADRLVLTKTDLAPETAALEARLRTLNPRAELTPSPACGGGSGWGDRPSGRAGTSPHPNPPPQAGEGSAAHSHGIASFDLRWSEALAWQKFVAALERLLAQHGERVLRVKGVARLAEQARPMVIHAVQHTLFPPAALGRAADPPGSFLTFVTDQLPRQAIDPYFAEVTAS